MAHPQTSETLQGKASGPTGMTNAPSIKRASALFVVSLSSFIGASLLLASF